MRLTIKIIPRAHTNEVVEKTNDKILKIRVTAPPVDGRANEQLIEILSAHFKKPKNAITIVKGASGRTKIIDIQD